MRPARGWVREVARVGLMLLVSLAVGAVSAPAQTPASGAALWPDTVRVGDPFVLGLSVSGDRETSPEFPALIPLAPELEQLGPAEVEWDDAGGGRWRARYRLAAWKAGTWSFAPILVTAGAAELSLAPPPVFATSVLPAASEGPLPLEGPWGPNRIRGFPWWLLLLLLAAALLWWLLRRLRRPEEEEEPVWTDPAADAREALARLKQGLQEGDLDLAAYYDGLEDTLRRYLAAREGWPPQRPVREYVDEASVEASLNDLEAGLRSLQGRAGLVRFAHVDAAESAALGDADACVAWVDALEEAA